MDVCMVLFIGICILCMFTRAYVAIYISQKFSVSQPKWWDKVKDVVTIEQGMYTPVPHFFKINTAQIPRLSEINSILKNATANYICGRALTMHSIVTC